MPRSVNPWTFIRFAGIFLPFLPDKCSRVLDLGAGVGQNASALSDMGYQVVAVEPLRAFIDLANAYYPHSTVRWLNDSMPKLVELGAKNDKFDFVLMDGVWHHLDYRERAQTVRRLSELIAPSGKCALSLRNGPPGLGHMYFPSTRMTP